MYLETYAKRGGAAWNAPGGGNNWETFTFREMYSYTTAGLMAKKRLKVLGRYSPAYPVASDFLESSYTFDNEGKMTGQTYPAAHWWSDETETAGQSLSYGFDGMGRPSTMPGWISGVTYNEAGQPTAISTTNPLVAAETRSYNVLGQLTTLNAGGLVINYNFSATQNDGRIVSQTSGGETVTYGYDSLNRLSSASSSGGWSAAYGHDGFGNLLTVTPTGAGPSAMNVTVNAATNRVNGWTYDSNGNVTAMPGGFTGSYDVENRLLETTKNSTMLYGYGADNRRIWEVKRGTVASNGDTIEEYVTYWSGQRIAKYKVRWNGTISSGPPDSFVFARVEENVYFGSKPLKLGSETNIAVDRLGSIRRGSGKDYFPYGQENPSTTAGDREKYATYKHDAATDLSYADQRYYATGAGRFMTADPYRASAGAGDPGSWNRYAYVNSDPVGNVDVGGLSFCGAEYSFDQCYGEGGPMWHGFMPWESPYGCWEMIRSFAGNATSNVTWGSCAQFALPGMPLLMAAMEADQIAAEKQAEAMRAKLYCQPEVIAAMKQAWVRGGNGTLRTEAGFSVNSSNGGNQILHSGNPNTQDSTQIPLGTNPVGVFHTHPTGRDPKPSPVDKDGANKLGIPFYTMTRDGLYEYDSNTKQTTQVRRNLDWLKPCP